MIVAEYPKIFDVQCIWRRILVSLEKIFIFSVFVDYILFSFYVKYICKKKITRTSLGTFFWVPMPFKRYQITS